MDGERLDAFARTFALSRRRGLRVLAGGLTAAALGLQRGEPAAAAKGGNSAAAKFCVQAFGAGTPKAGACTRQAAHGTGPYVECGGDPTRLCPTANGVVCCTDANPTCYEGQCQCVAPGNIDTTTGQEDRVCAATIATTVATCSDNTVCLTCTGRACPSIGFCEGGNLVCCPKGEDCTNYPVLAVDSRGFCVNPLGPVC